MQSIFNQRARALTLTVTFANTFLCACSQTPGTEPQGGQVSAASQPPAAGARAAPGTPTNALTPTGASAMTPAKAAAMSAAGSNATSAGSAATQTNAATGGAPAAGGMGGGAQASASAGAGTMPAMAGTGPSTAGANAAAAGASGSVAPATACEKGKTKADEVIVMGESFYAINPNIINQLHKNARAAGAISMSDRYRSYAVSGQLLTGTIPGQFDQAIDAGPVKLVIMDGGGNDCMSSPCEMCPATFEMLLKKMDDNKVENVIYTRYPEPGNPPGSLTTLKKNLDILMPKMEAVCSKTTAPKCHWVDLRPIWKDGDTSDGLHPTASGGEHVGDAIWAKMVEQCIAQ